MEIAELRKKNEAELLKLLAHQREVFRDTRFKVTAKQYKDVRDLRSVKKDIARILTVLKEKRVLREYESRTSRKLTTQQPT
ncbi:MAG: 50S ribosomal protein L29 [Patescibacteria group bacterium]